MYRSILLHQVVCLLVLPRRLLHVLLLLYRHLMLLLLLLLLLAQVVRIPLRQKAPSLRFQQARKHHRQGRCCLDRALTVLAHLEEVCCRVDTVLLKFVNVIVYD